MYLPGFRTHHTTCYISKFLNNLSQTNNESEFARRDKNTWIFVMAVKILYFY